MFPSECFPFNSEHVQAALRKNNVLNNRRGEHPNNWGFKASMLTAQTDWTIGETLDCV